MASKYQALGYVKKLRELGRIPEQGTLQYKQPMAHVPEKKPG